MGPLFALIFQLILVCILSGILGVIALGLTYFIAGKHKKKRKLFLAFTTPFLAIGTIYVLLLISSIAISFIKDVDIGIGDAWHVPLNGNSYLLMIDVMDDGDIMCGDEPVSLVSYVTHLQMVGDKVFLKNQGGQFMTVDLVKCTTVSSTSIDAIKRIEGLAELELVEIDDFYFKRKQEVAGAEMNIGFAVSLLVTLLAVFVFVRLVLYDWNPRKSV
ncbi:MAG: hypothetical protein ACJATE_002384 [Bacteroidia bacterium]|jgi:hypothetical protein